MEFKNTLNETLEARFDDIDEMEDSVSHGMVCGFSDFIHIVDINEFFEEFLFYFGDILTKLYPNFFKKNHYR